MLRRDKGKSAARRRHKASGPGEIRDSGAAADEGPGWRWPTLNDRQPLQVQPEPRCHVSEHMILDGYGAPVRALMPFQSGIVVMRTTSQSGSNIRLPRTWALWWIAAALVLLVALPGTGNAQAGPPGGGQWVPGQVLVKPKAGLPDAQLDRILRQHQGRAVGRINAINVRIVSVPPQAEDAVVRALSRNPHISFAEKNYLVQLSEMIPNDPRFPDAWHLARIDASGAWGRAKAKGIVVAVLDTGFEAEHPDLADRLLRGYNAVDGSSDTSPVHSHGTRIAGIVAAATDNATGVAAVAWDAMILPVRVSNRSDGVASLSDIARGLSWAADNGAHVANISYNVSHSLTVGNAAQYMRNKGGVVVVAAGNSGGDPGYPDNPYMISVSATTSSDSLASWSSYGDYVNLSAPGASILTTTPGGGYTSVSGTSAASPVAAGVAALVMGANGSLKSADVEKVLFETADDLGAPGWDPYYGWGRVNAERAVARAASLRSTDTQAPVVNIKSPSHGDTVSGVVNVDVSATDNVGVSRVDLYVNGSLVGRELTAPYEFAWDASLEQEGTSRLRAEAFDAAGNRGTDSIDVTVRRDEADDDEGDAADTEPPVVRILSPADGSTVSGTTRLEASATDNVGVVRMEIAVNGRTMCASDRGEVSCNWNTRRESNGDYTISATARDAAGNTGRATVTVRIGSGDSGDDDSDSEGGGGGGPPPGRGWNR
jgi:thermitase